MKTNTCILAILLAAGLTSSRGQGTWTQKADFGGTARAKAVGFSIGSKGYIGTGYDGHFGFYPDLWEYDPATNAWTQKADVPFEYTGRYSAVGFSIGNKGYVGLGIGANEDSDFWEYDPATDTWTRKADFRNIAFYGREGAVGFSIGSKGYVGTGQDQDLNGFRDFWEYDPAADRWKRMASYGTTHEFKVWAVGFSIGSKGYIGTGTKGGPFTNDFWEYDSATNTWTQRASFGGARRAFAVGFSIRSKGYIGTGLDDSSGYLKDFGEYDPTTNTWTKKADFGGTARSGAVGFPIGNKGYIGTGADDSGYLKDFWEYTPDRSR